MENSPPTTTSSADDEFFDDIGIEYEQAFGHDPGLHRNLQNFLRLLPAHSRVLDCGCGTGKPVSHAVVESGRQVHGIDLSQTMINLSRKQVPTGTFEKVDMLNYAPTSPASFAGIVAMFSLFVLTRQQMTTMAQKWCQWLQPSGFLLLGCVGAEDYPATTADMYDPDGQYTSGIPSTFMSRPVSMALFTKVGWKSLLEQAGFEIVRTEVDVFKPAAAANSADERHYFLIARKPASGG